MGKVISHGQHRTGVQPATVPQRIRLTRSGRSVAERRTPRLDTDGSVCADKSSCCHVAPTSSKSRASCCDGTTPVRSKHPGDADHCAGADHQRSATVADHRGRSRRYAASVQVYFEQRHAAARAPHHHPPHRRERRPHQARKRQDEFALKIPIIQGEYDRAHLCRLVGTLEIKQLADQGELAGGFARCRSVLELDRGGQLSARALVPSLEPGL